MSDPTSMIGSLYKLPLLLYILAVIFMFLYMEYGWLGPIAVVVGAVGLLYLKIKKERESVFV